MIECPLTEAEDFHNEVERLNAQLELAKEALKNLANTGKYLRTTQLNGIAVIDLILYGVPWKPWSYAAHVLEELEKPLDNSGE